MLEAITLDFYGTLVHDDELVFASICQAVAASVTHSKPSPDDIAERWYGQWEYACPSAHGQAFRSLRTLCRDALADVVQKVGGPADPDQLLAPQFAYWRRPKLFPDAEDFLDNTLPVCVVSDGDDLAAALTHHDLRFDHVVTSEDARAYKPRPEPFERDRATRGQSRSYGPRGRLVGQRCHRCS